MVKVKICGITNQEDALAAAAAGCDALGFVFYKKSPRYVRPAEAAKICRALPAGIIKIGVFVNARSTTVRTTARQVGLDMLQFHGHESPQFCRRFSGYKVIKAFRLRGRIDPKTILRYDVFAFLFDAYVAGKFGGTGKTARWSFLAKSLAGIKTPIFLSGGLNERNLAQAIRTVRPQWVDASSCLEITPGRKDHRKIKRFVAAAKRDKQRRKGMPRILIVAGICLAALTLNARVYAQARTYTNSVYNYSVQYPADYEYKPIGGIITFASTKMDKRFQFAHNVNVMVGTLGGKIPSLDDFFAQSKARLKKNLPNVDFLEEKPGKVAGLASRRLVYTTRQKEAMFKILQEMFIHKNQVFVITFTDLAEGYNAHIGQAEKMIRTFKVLNEGP